ncbi:MAG: hypothetical protein M3Z85_06275 [Acidobacteriota bacterium]|nr:hypothetical protein [Acidobacteriota bacterium]
MKILIPYVFLSITTCICFGQQSSLGEPPTAPVSDFGSRPFSRAFSLTTDSVSSATPCWYDTSNRSVVANAYNALNANGSTAMGWTGSFNPPAAGTTSAAYQTAILTAINWARAMGGVPCITGLDPAESLGDQQAAFMMMTNAQLSHSPPNTWLNWTQAGADAAGKSNLCLGRLGDPGCIQQYMIDSGNGNDEAGHRRWILYPQTTVMGTGDVPGNGNGYAMANALWVIDPSTYGNPRPATRDSFVAWPARGYVPYQTIPVRWSFSYAGADFSAATVTMQRNGAAVPVSLETVHNGYGENTLVWVPDNQDPNASPANNPPGSDTPVTVTVNNVSIGGVARNFSYQVIVFDPGASVAAPPTADSVTPNAGSGFGATFTLKYTSASGFGALSDTYALFNSGISAANGCVVYYDRAANGFFLFNDGGSGTIGPLAPGAGATLQNTQCTLTGTGSSVSGSNGTLTMNLNLSFANSFAGTQTIYMYAFADGGLNTGWQNRGTWTIPGANQPPTADSITPGSGSGASQSFVVKYSSPGGYANVTGAHLLFNTALTGTNGCWILYDKASHGFLLANDAGSGFTGPLAPGGNTAIQNSQCTLNGLGTSISGESNTLTFTLNLKFTNAFAGVKKIYMYTADSAGRNSSWQNRGSWTVTAATPAPTSDSVTPNASGGASGSFAFRYSSPNGSGYISDAYVLFDGALNGAHACWILYDKPSNGLYLVNDPGYGTVGPLAPGTSGTLQNSQCALSGTGSSVAGAGNTLTLTLNLSFTKAFAGTQSIFMYASDDAALSSGWQTRGTWTVPGN